MKKKTYLLHTYVNGVYQRADIFHSGSSVMWFLRRNGCALSQNALSNLGDDILVVDGRDNLLYEVEELVS